MSQKKSSPKPTIRQRRMWDVTRHLLGLQVNLLRERNRWSLMELAQKSGCPVSVIEALEEGKLSAATPKELGRLANAFDVALLVRFTGFREFWPKAFKEEKDKP